MTWIRSHWLALVIGAIAIVLLAACAAYPVALRASEKTVTLKVQGKESVNKDGGHEYRVYTDRGVYVVKDSIVYFNFRAADRYNTLEGGRTYRCKQAGWRSGLLSMFPNLISCESA